MKHALALSCLMFLPATALAQLPPRVPSSAPPPGCQYPIIGLPDTGTLIVSRPGHYCLVRNLKTTASGSAPAIAIVADDVTLDLNGFRLVGPGDAATERVGIGMTGRGITIRNGTIAGFYMGIYVSETGVSRGNLIDRVRVENATFIGINVTCICTFPTGTGLIVRNSWVQDVGGSTVSSTSGYAYGVFLGSLGAQAIGNVVMGVIGNEARGIFSFGVALLAGNHVTGSDEGYGIDMGGAEVVYRDNTVLRAPIPYNGGTSAGGNYP